MVNRLVLLLGFLSFFLSGFAQPKNEFRGVWVATVDNIDWPSRGNYNTDSQKAEYTKLLDMHQRNGMNAVIVQVRPATDAFYPSPYEPWSEWLTGKQGKPPVPYYDPLKFMIEEAHRRGMEFHAWCNPYRAEFAIGKSSIAANHVTRTHPEWFFAYGNTRYFDPGNKEARQFVVNVIRDIVSRYDVDAIHFDDYFYPYRIAGKEFPDDASYQQYGNGLSRDDWRRSNTDSIIYALSKAIKEEKKHVRFGISPFGVWRNSSKDSLGSPTHAGLTNYDDLYADILLWLREGWIDYVAPQLYWEFEHSVVPFGVLLDWWSKHSYGKHCYIGLGIYKAGTNAAWRDKTQLPRMISDIRKMPGAEGAIYFSSKSFEKNPNGWNDSLQQNYYKWPAIVPPMPWIDSAGVQRPVVSVTRGVSNGIGTTLSIQNLDTSQKLRAFVVYAFDKSDTVRNTGSAKNILRIIPATTNRVDYLVLQQDAYKQFAVSSLNNENNESEPVFLPPLYPASAHSSSQ